MAYGTAWLASPELGPEQQQSLERLNAIRAQPGLHLDDFEATFERESRSRECDDTRRKCLNPLRDLEVRPPLAPTDGLGSVAQAHAQAMAEGGWFAHVDPAGLGPNERVRRAGIALDGTVESDGRVYSYGGGSTDNQMESIYSHGSYSTSGAKGPGEGVWARGIDSMIVDRCVEDRGHREHLMGRTVLAAEDREVGVGGAVVSAAHLVEPALTGWTMRLVVLTRIRTDDTFYVVGSVTSDADGDGRYDVGEQLAGETVSIPELGLQTKTASGGGFVLPVPDGAKGTVVHDGDAVPFSISGANTQVSFRM
ncbi:MAG: CAP domain-containing protein [Proteobacteria bacterium]|nr:CAP domain-containing protein [Pseudomonadota bacterium]